MRWRHAPRRGQLDPLPDPLTVETLDAWVDAHAHDDVLHRRAVVLRLLACMASGGRSVDPVEAAEVWTGLADGTTDAQ